MPDSAGLVHVGGEPAPVPDLAVRALVERVQAVWRAGGLPSGPAFQPGEPVIVRDGVFEGYRAIFDVRLPGSERARVLLKMLNDRYVPLEIDLASLEKESPSIHLWH